eukprot:948956-Pleurochrysis_carterae.AAC.1
MFYCYDDSVVAANQPAEARHDVPSNVIHRVDLKRVRGDIQARPCLLALLLRFVLKLDELHAELHAEEAAKPARCVSTHHSAPCCRPATRPGEQSKCKKAQSRGACHESHMPRTTLMVARVLYKGTKSRHNRYKLNIPELPQAIACRLDLAGQKHLNKDRNRGNGPVLE